MAGGYSPYTGGVTLTSSGTSTAIPLEPTARVTTLAVAPSITSTSTQGANVTYRVEVTLDTYVPGGVTTVWQNISSQTYSAASTSTSAFTLIDGTFLTVLGPIAGVRLNSTTTWSPATGSLTLKALQSVTAGP